MESNWRMNVWRYGIEPWFPNPSYVKERMPLLCSPLLHAPYLLTSWRADGLATRAWAYVITGDFRVDFEPFEYDLFTVVPHFPFGKEVEPDHLP